MTTVKLYKTNGVEATVIVYTMYCDIFESALLFTEYKKVWIKLI